MILWERMIVAYVWGVMMAQTNLNGETKEQEERRLQDQYQREWFEQQIIELRDIRDNIEYYDELSKEPRDEYGHQPYELERVMGAWWYCNHIVGWDNKIPYKDPSKEYVPIDYDGVPLVSCMADSIRDCFLAVRRDEVAWDKEHAIRRLNKAIEEYEKALASPKPSEDKMADWEVEEVGVYDDDAEGNEMEYEVEEVENEDAEVEEEIKVVRGKPKTIDKAQAKLDIW